MNDVLNGPFESAGLSPEFNQPMSPDENIQPETSLFLPALLMAPIGIPIMGIMYGWHKFTKCITPVNSP